jgi:hypothetical protein
MTTKVVNINKDNYDLYIGRPSKWGNPFSIGKDGTRKEVIQKYREWIVSQENLLDSLSELEGKRLGCYCSPQACHGDVLIELLEGTITNKLLI